MRILGLAGSIRSRSNRIDELSHFIETADSQQQLHAKIKQSEGRFANSDISLAFALFSARKAGASTKLISLKDIFDNSFEAPASQEKVQAVDHISTNKKKTLALLTELEQSDGVIFSTPVYFGDRSSIANKFMQLTSPLAALKNKVFGTIAVGAKRNGGQETACIYSLTEALAQNAYAVGNGPNTSQYGGTVVAGDRGSALSDEWGLERCSELGEKVVRTAEIITLGSKKINPSPLKVKVLMTMDSQDKRFKKYIQQLFGSAHSDGGIDLEILDLIDAPIARCIGCNVCPAGGNTATKNEVNCIFRDKEDCLHKFFPKIMDADAIFIAGVNTNDEIIYRYQAFTERTRCIRRDNYKLSNMPITGILINDPSATNSLLHNSKVITSYIRHNTIILNPLQIIQMGGTTLYCPDPSETLAQARVIRDGRRHIAPLNISYKAEGYIDKSQDDVFSTRL